MVRVRGDERRRWTNTGLGVRGHRGEERKVLDRESEWRRTLEEEIKHEARVSRVRE